MKKIQKILIIFGIFIFIPMFAMAEFKISEYKYQKDLISQEEKKGNFSFVLDNDVYKNGNQFFYDLRVVDKNNNEIPYVIKKSFDKVDSKTHDVELKIVYRNKNTYVLDMGEKPEYHQSIDVVTESSDFSRVVDVYGSNLMDSRFEKINLNKEGDLIAVVPGNNDKNISFKYKNYRYIKLVFSGSEGEFNPKKFTIKKTETKKTPGEKENFNLKMEILEPENSKEQKILFESIAENIPIDHIIINSVDRDFSRNIKIYLSNDKNAKFLNIKKRYDKNTNYWKKIYDGNFSEQIYSDEQVFSIKDNKKYILVIINNADNNNLNITGATATRFLDSVYLQNLDFKNNSYKIFYGNIFAKKPKYDVMALQKKVSSNKDFLKLKLSKQENNVLYLLPKDKFGDEKPNLIYIFIGILVIILFWFVYKIIRETSLRDEKEDIDIIDKL